MKKILNPFEYLSTEKAFLWGILGAIFAICLMICVRWPVHFTVSEGMSILSMNLLLWLPLSTLLYVAALVFSPSRIRAIDIYASNLFAMLPIIILCGVSNMVSGWLVSLNADPQSVAEILVRASYNLLVIIISIGMVWSMVWGCFAYSVSANIKGWSGLVIFVICYVLVNVVIQTTLQYV